MSYIMGGYRRATAKKRERADVDRLVGNMRLDGTPGRQWLSLRRPD